MERVDWSLEGEDAEDVALMLRVPELPDGGWGWRGLLRAAADLRTLQVRSVQERLGLEVEVRITPMEA